MNVKDILPLIRGGFIDKNGVEYSSIQDPYTISAYNIKFE